MAAAVAWLLGTLAAHQLPALPGARWLVPLLLVCMLVLRARRARPLLWFAGACVWTIATAGTPLAERLAPTAAGDVPVAGWVDTFPTRAPGQATFGFTVPAPRPPGIPPRLRLTWYDAPPTLAAADALRLTVRLRAPHGARNPHGFDYEQWLLTNGYGATGYVRAAAPGAMPPRLAARWLKFRATLAARIAAAVPDPDGAALLIALALGERYRFTEQHWADFRRTGTSHLVAVSGMHIALLGVLAFAVARWLMLWLPTPLATFDLEVSAVASVAVTAYYAALTGFAVPAQRSLVMIAVALAVLVSRRAIGAWQILATTLLVVLIWDPFAPLSASFWLSFTAVAILLALGAARRLPAPPQSAGWRGWRAWRACSDFVSLQWSIGIALVPLTAWCFGTISLLGPLVNLVAIPAFSLLLVPLTVLASVALSFDSLVGVATPAVALVGHLASATVAGLHAAAELPGAALPIPLPPWPAFAVALAGVAAAVAGDSLPGRRFAWLALLPMFVPAPSLPADGEARAVVLDVGQGLAVLVETRAHRLLFDAGPALPFGVRQRGGHRAARARRRRPARPRFVDREPRRQRPRGRRTGRCRRVPDGRDSAGAGRGHARRPHVRARPVVALGRCRVPDPASARGVRPAWQRELVRARGQSGRAHRC